MSRAVRISMAALGIVALLIALAAYLLHARAPPEPALSARPAAGTIRVGGRDRAYLLYVPARRAVPSPLLVVFHGSMGSPGTVRAETGYGFDRLADREGFVVAYPRGHEGNWNDCRRAADYPARRLGVDDTGFFDLLVERLASERGVDPGRVFVAGVSNGGHFVFRLALERPEALAGAAVFAANLPAPRNNACRPHGTPPPILLVNGTDDPINPFEGGRVTLFGFGDRGDVLSARRSAARLAGAGVGRVTSRIPAKARGDPTWVERSVWRRPGGPEVALLAVHGGGHVVPQPAYRPRRLLGRATSAIDGPAEAWAFFRRQPPRPPR